MNINIPPIFLETIEKAKLFAESKGYSSLQEAVQGLKQKEKVEIE